MRDARPDSPGRTRNNMHSYGRWLHDASALFEERSKRTHVLEHMRRKDDVNAVVGQRNCPAVVYAHRVIHTLVPWAIGEVQCNHIASFFREEARLIPRTCSELQP